MAQLLVFPSCGGAQNMFMLMGPPRRPLLKGSFSGWSVKSEVALKASAKLGRTRKKCHAQE